MTLRKITKYIEILLLIITLCFTGCLKKDNKTTIKFSTWGSETEISILRPIVEDFEKQNPDIDVEIVHIPQNYFQKLHMLVAANLTPDVIFINNLNLAVYGSGNILADLTPNIENSKILNKQSFFKESLETLSYDNKILAIPRDISDLVIYYNKDLFDRNNLEYPDKNWTLSKFLETAKNLTADRNKDGKIDTFGVSFDTLAIFYLPFVWSEGGKLLKNDNKSFAMSDKTSCQALQFYADLRNHYHVAPKASEAGNNTMAQLFMQEKIAMFISGRWSVPRFRQDLKFKWDIIRFPAGKSGSVVGIDGSGWAISNKSKHKAEAWKLIEYLASADSITRFTKTGLIVPSRKDVAYSKTFLDDNLEPENAETFLSIIPDGKPTPKIERWNEINDLINVALEPVWNGNKSSCEALNKIKKDVNELLE